LRQLTEQQGNPEIYDLTGVVLHTGTALGGHYTSCLRINEKWYAFNDTQVKVLCGFIDGAQQIVDRPEAYLSGEDASVHLNEYL
jgi:ubiquitin C-terminal hydrolase